ncbi:hypothetical protein KI387_004244 [Taxus chinensis]|uniref:Cation/H+ exchanger transmembrane domain-containing protein n=1 Tax=Taxus chinensis TaxID=29808 RepID=A0AA38LHP8_TAXCH|nr:hypothetical protein KI387_004244 [Taxus chinensis]
MNARVEDSFTIQDVQEATMPWEEAIPHKSVDVDTFNLHAPIVEGVSTILGVREADMPWEDGFPNFEKQFVVDRVSTIPNALTMHGEMVCPTTHLEVLARRTVEHEQFTHCVVKDLSQQRGIDEQIDEELVLTPTTVETETTAETEMVISPTIAELVLTPTAQMVTFLFLKKLDEHCMVVQGRDRGDFDCRIIESLYRLQLATQDWNRFFNPHLQGSDYSTLEMGLTLSAIEFTLFQFGSSHSVKLPSWIHVKKNSSTHSFHIQTSCRVTSTRRIKEGKQHEIMNFPHKHFSMNAIMASLCFMLFRERIQQYKEREQEEMIQSANERWKGSMPEDVGIIDLTMPHWSLQCVQEFVQIMRTSYVEVDHLVFNLRPASLALYVARIRPDPPRILSDMYATDTCGYLPDMSSRIRDISGRYPHVSVAYPFLNTYMLAEGFGLSGIVAILFCGIVMKHYTFSNLSEKSQTLTAGFFELISSLAETFVFIYMGLDIATEQQSWSHVGFIFFSILFIGVARAANVFPCAYLINFMRPASRQIPMKHQKALWFCGLRGAMAFALALQSVHELPDGHGQTIFTATTAIVVLTVLLIGGSTATMLEALEVTGDSHSTDFGEGSEEESDYIAPYDEETITSSSGQNLTTRFKEFRKSTATFSAIDKNFLTPFFTANGDVRGRRVSNGNEAQDSARQSLRTSNENSNSTSSPLLQITPNGQDHHMEGTSDQRSRWISPGNHLQNDKYRNMYAQSKDNRVPGKVSRGNQIDRASSVGSIQDGKPRWPSL